MRSILYMILGSSTLFLSLESLGQREKRDTSGTGSVDIISNFKPTLRDPLKIQFQTATPATETERPRLVYRIPNQELSIAYQPGTLKPLAYQADSNKGFQTTQFAKVGYGNLRNPYASLALAFGKRLPVHFYGMHQSASGRLPHQEYSFTRAEIGSRLASGQKGEWLGTLLADRQVYHKYGFDNNTPAPLMDSIRQVFHQLGIQLAYRRKQPTASGFYLEPVLDWKRTADRLGNADMHIRLQIPVQYHFNDKISLHLQGLVHWGRIKPVGGAALDQSVYSIHPSLQFIGSVLSAQVGIRPSWDADGMRMYPDLRVKWQRSGKPWLLSMQWTGELQRVGYRELYTVNPWLWMPHEWRNQGKIDRSLHWRYDRRAHWVYELQAGYATLQDAFLFINDTTAAGDGKSFQTLYADRIQNLYAKGKLSYRQSDRLLIRAEAGWNNFHGIKGVEKAWGLLPFEWNLHGTYRFRNQLRIQADVYSWLAPLYLTKGGLPSRTEGAFDVNLGAEMPITRSIRGWLQFNNLLNRSYSRWSQYPAFGFHFVGGVVFSLDKSLF